MKDNKKWRMAVAIVLIGGLVIGGAIFIFVWVNTPEDMKIVERIINETVVVEKPVKETVIVKETVEVEKEITKIVEKIVEETVIVEVEKIVERTVKETVVVKETVIVEKTVSCPTATPTPTATMTTSPTVTMTATPTANSFILYEDLRNQTPLVEFEFGEGSAFNPDDWDYKANGLVSLIRIPKGASATFEFEWWGPEAKWNVLIESYKIHWGPGEYNLQRLFFPSGERDLNDTLQRVVVHNNGNITLYEHDIAPLGIEIVLN